MLSVPQIVCFFIFGQLANAFTTYKLGGPCNGDEGAVPDITDNTRFLHCDTYKNIFVWYKCPKVNDGGVQVQKVFDKTFMECRWPDSFLLNAAGSAKVGEQCTYNTDCLEGMYCSTGTCTCLSTYVEVDKFCYQKIDPSRRGCQYAEQCSAVWPGATCDLTGAQGQCNCPNDPNGVPYVAVQTKDGFLCMSQENLAAGAGRCPLPDLTGTTSVAWRNVLQYSGSTAADAACKVGDLSTTDPTLACFSAGAGANPSGVYVGDLFDCVPKDLTVAAPATAEAGVCCPNRAYTCIQPQATLSPADPNTAETRWWYNSVTRTCEQFYWTPPSAVDPPSTSNSNNFKTRTQCQTYCQDTCTRGYPEYTGIQASGFGTPSTCTTTGSATSCADNDHECTTIGSQQFCCSTTEFLCSRQGGRAQSFAPANAQLNYDSGFTPFGTVPASIQRFFFNEDTNQCEPFTYLTAGGNFNNFLSRADCQNFCQKLLCDYGSPILDSSGQQYQQCSSSSSCPSTHTCNSNVCCPTVQTICAEPKQLGSCSQFTTRYWYNAISQECEPFDFTGCQGNDNNFNTLIECQTFCRNARPEPKCIQGEAYKDANGNYYRCSNSQVGNQCPNNYDCYYDGFVYGCCPRQAYTCSLTSNIGATCGSQSSRWYYDTQTQTCQTFTYLGCNGNSNNFATRQLCESYCGVGGCPYGGDPYRESDNTLRLCSAGISCPSSHTCQQVSVGTGTLNYCCPTRSLLCSTPPNQSATCGSGQAITRYYYNRAVNQCLTFQYYGCGTAANNFATLSQCTNFCNSAGCALGETAYIDPNGNKALTCNAALNGTCPTGYSCTFDDLNNNNICCGSTDMGVCPSTEKAFIDAYSMQPKECLPNVAGTCSDNFLCRFLNSANKYYCCKADSYCPVGKNLFEDPLTARGRRCLLNTVVNSCPAGYSCQSNVPNSFQGFCCTINPVCPNGGQFYPDRNRNNQALTCVLSQFGSNPCPPNYQCIPSAANTTAGYCCAGSVASVCGSGTPYVLNSNPVTCQGNSQGVTCPVGYNCQQFGTSGIFYCCQGGGAPNLDGCGAGQVAYRGLNNQISTCSNAPLQAAASSCPIGFSCQYSFTSSRFQCCGFQGGCPANRALYQDNTGQTQLCQLNQANTCPFGFTCTQSTQNAQGICCSTGGSQVQPNIGGRAGERCGVNNQCTGGSVCTGNVCTCRAGQAPAGGQCVQGLSACIRGTEYLYPSIQTPIDCTPVQTNCPPGYSCSLSTAYGGYFICCSGTRKLRGEALVKAHKYLQKQEREKTDRRNKQVSRDQHGSGGNPMNEFNKGWTPLGGVDSDPYEGYSDKLGEIQPWSPGASNNVNNQTAPIGYSNNVTHVNLPFPQPWNVVTTPAQPTTVQSNVCDPAQRVSMGRDCCADSQCQYHCGSFRGKSICVCPRHLMLDLTRKPPRCVTSCSKWREGAFCIATNPYEKPIVSQYAPLNDKQQSNDESVPVAVPVDPYVYSWPNIRQPTNEQRWRHNDDS